MIVAEMTNGILLKHHGILFNEKIESINWIFPMLLHKIDLIFFFFFFDKNAFLDVVFTNLKLHSSFSM